MCADWHTFFRLFAPNDTNIRACVSTIRVLRAGFGTSRTWVVVHRDCRRARGTLRKTRHWYARSAGTSARSYGFVTWRTTSLVQGAGQSRSVQKKGRAVTQADKRMLDQILESATVIRKCGKAAVAVQAGRRLGAGDAKRILRKEKRLWDRIFELIMDAERQALKRRSL